MKLKIALIRHGEVERLEGGLLGFNGDGPLSENGIKSIQERCAAKVYPKLKHVYSSEPLCCRDTAALIYSYPAVILKELRMPNPAEFDGQALRKPLENTTSFNIGTLYDVSARVGSIIRKIGAEMEIKKAEQCAIISRKMVILEILRRYYVPRSSYEDWELPFGGGYFVEYDTVDETAKILNKI